MAFTAAKLELVENRSEGPEARSLQGLFYGRNLEAEQDRAEAGRCVDERCRWGEHKLWPRRRHPAYRR